MKNKMNTAEAAQFLMDCNVIKAKSLNAGKNILLRWYKDNLLSAIPGGTRRAGLTFKLAELERFIEERKKQTNVQVPSILKELQTKVVNEEVELLREQIKQLNHQKDKLEKELKTCKHLHKKAQKPNTNENPVSDTDAESFPTEEKDLKVRIMGNPTVVSSFIEDIKKKLKDTYNIEKESKEYQNQLHNKVRVYLELHDNRKEPLYFPQKWIIKEVSNYYQTELQGGFQKHHVEFTIQNFEQIIFEYSTYESDWEGDGDFQRITGITFNRYKAEEFLKPAQIKALEERLYKEQFKYSIEQQIKKTMKNSSDYKLPGLIMFFSNEK